MSDVSHGAGQWPRTSDGRSNRRTPRPALTVAVILGLFIGSAIAGGCSTIAASVPSPKLSALIPTSEKVTSTTTVQLTEAGPTEQIVETAMSCRLGYITCGNLPPFYNGGGYPSRDLFLLAWNDSTRHWSVVFDAAKTTLFPERYGFISQIKTSTITPTKGTTDLVVSALLTPGANSQLNVGIVHYNGKTASLSYSDSFLDGISAHVTGASSHQLLQLTLGWITDADPVAGPVRSYIQMIGWESQAHGLPGSYRVVSDNRSWLGVSISVEPSDISTPTIPNSPIVLSVVPDSPAFGVLKPGDTLLGVEGVSPRANLIGSPVIDQIVSQQPGTRIALSIERGGSERVVDVTLSSYASKAHNEYADGLLGLPYLGVETADLTPQFRQKDGIATKSGAVIIGVMSGSPADNAGLVAGDVIVAVDSQRITDTQDLSGPIPRLVSLPTWTQLADSLPESKWPEAGRQRHHQ